MEQRQMSEKDIELLVPAISKLSEEEQEQIVGGAGDMVSITNKQCDMIKEICRREDTPTSREIMACANYGCRFPRADFERYQDKLQQMR